MMKNKSSYFVVSAILLGAICFYFLEFKQPKTRDMVGVYWGAFDPPTSAHHAVISTALQTLQLEKIIIVVNNHNYKNYTYPLETRLTMVKEILNSDEKEFVELLWQDDQQKIDYTALIQITEQPLCAIAGYDAYLAWMKHSTTQERALFSAIAVIPRGGETPHLFDSNAFLLPIGEEYKFISSTKIREAFIDK